MRWSTSQKKYALVKNLTHNISEGEPGVAELEMLE